MTNKLSAILTQVQSHWKRPERRLVEDAPVEVLRAMWSRNHDDVLTLQIAYEDARRTTAIMTEFLPVVRDIRLWTQADIGVSFSLFCDRLGVAKEEVVRELFGGMSRELLAIVSHPETLTCPLCQRKK